MLEYFEKDHAESVPTQDLNKPVDQVYYLPIHVVCKKSSSTSKVRAVFDASAPSSTGVSLNDTLLVGPTTHSSLFDVLLRFRLYRIALTTDISRMYRAILLDCSDKDLHRFVWRADPSQPLRDYRMTRITFGVSASSYIANMSVKQNAHDLASTYHLAARVVDNSFYVDDGLIGADSVEEAIELQRQMQELFDRGGFTFRKWNSNNPKVLAHIPDEFRELHTVHALPETPEYPKTLGIEWSTVSDHFRLTISELPPINDITKRVLISDVSKTFDVFGWFSPCMIIMKVLFQRLWQLKVGWDDVVPESVREPWLRWRSELNVLSSIHVPRCYYPKNKQITSLQLHGFSDASELAFAAVVYLHVTVSTEEVYVSLVASKTRVAPIKRLTVPRLELCGACLLAELLRHIQGVFGISSDCLFAWTDSTIVLAWLVGNPNRFKTYVANRISQIVELVAPERWHHVDGVGNPADCASRGLFPTELIDYDLWWHGPPWLKQDSSLWPTQSVTVTCPSEEEVPCHVVSIDDLEPLIPLDRYSSFSHLTRVTAWVIRFAHNCRGKANGSTLQLSHSLSIGEIVVAENYWYSLIQHQHFPHELTALHNGKDLHHSSCLIALHPFLDSCGLLRVGGRIHKAKIDFPSRHPVVIHGQHPISKLIIRSEHVRLLHAGPTLLTCMLNRRFHIIGGRRSIRSITRSCIICRRTTVRPQDQLMGQLPTERISIDCVFSQVGLDYAGPFLLKVGHTRRPTIVKAYACLFVSLSVKAVHIELVSDLSTTAFIACLRRFVSRRGRPEVIWSDHGTNFVGAARELKEFVDFLSQQRVQKEVSEFCTSQYIKWEFIPERAPHLGGLWEAAVRSMKTHLRRIVSTTKLTFEELTTVLAQVESCMNSRPLVAMPSDDDGVEALTPGHFLIGRPLEAIPDSPQSYNHSLLRRWQLCQSLLRDFWKRWSTEYLASLQRTYKWHKLRRNISVGDIVLMCEKGLLPTRWPLARVLEVFPGSDDAVRVVKIKTANGTYTRPVQKIALILPNEP